MDNRVEIDSESRKKIVSVFDKNFFVEAGAGSGKTTMLVNRMVAMVEEGIDIRRICAITFTVAAAGEFYKRFQALLLERSNPDCEWDEEKAARPGSLKKPTPESAALCKEALKNIDLCFMGTIDSFCGRILSEHPSEARIPSDAGVISDDEKKGILRQEFVKICRGEYGKDLADKAVRFQTMHESNSEQAFLLGITTILNNFGADFKFDEPDEDAFKKECEALKTQVLELLRICVEHRSEIYAGAIKASRVAWDNLNKSYRDLQCNWLRNPSRVYWGIMGINNLGLNLDFPTKYDPSLDYYQKYYFDRTGTTGNLLDYICDFSSITDKLDEYKYSVSMSFLVESAKMIMDNFRKSGKLSFYDCLLYLRNMLRDDTKKSGKLIRYIYERHSYFLIDEFQDTNPMQAEIFFYLTALNPVEKWYLCEPRPGSLFVVGDPKQSIYRFRGADVQSYLKVKKLFKAPNGECLYLTRNFRSEKSLCDYYNRVFGVLLDTETATQSKFESIPPKAKTQDGVVSGIYTYVISNGDKGRASRPDLKDEVRVRKMIEILVNNPKYRIVPKDETVPRMITYKDIKIIPLNKTMMPYFIQELADHGIPTIAEGKVMFESCAELKAVYSIYAAVIDPYDNLALARALKSILLHQSLENMARYRFTGRAFSLNESQKEKNGEVSELPEDLVPLGDAIVRLRKLSKLANHLSPAALFERIFDDYELYRYLPINNPEIVYYALELIRNAENSGEIVSHMEGKKFMEDLLSGQDNPERCLSLKEDVNCVNIANLHKVKGLEAPVVILAYGWKMAPSVNSRIEYNDNSTDAYIFSVNERIEKSTKTYFCSDGPEGVMDLEVESLVAEDVRKIYVGATRGRNLLIISRLMPESDQKSFWYPLVADFGYEEYDFFKNFSSDAEEEGTEAGAAGAGEGEAEVGAGAAGETGVAGETGTDAEAAVEGAGETGEGGDATLAKELYEEAAKTCVLAREEATQATYELKLPSQLEKKKEKKKAGAVSAEAGTGADEDNTTDVGQNTDANVVEPTDDERISDDEERKVQAGEEKPEVALAHKRSDILGTLVHRLMECLVLSKNTMDADALINQIIDEQKAKSVLPLEGEMRDALAEVCTTIRAGGYAQVNGGPQDILAELLSAEQVCCETPFCFMEGSTLWSGIMDVIYKKDGQWHIVDYKTNIDGSNLDAEYSEQLNAYIHALKEITGEDADARIYHIGV